MNVKRELLLRLAQSKGAYISGSELAAELGVSRNAVWKAVKSLEDEGFVIDSVTAKGYRLSPESNKLAPELIFANLTSDPPGSSIIVLKEAESTNDTAKQLASQGAATGSVVIADRQISGKGRLGRSFVSPAEKGLYMSVIGRPDFPVSAAPLITSAAAVAAAEAVQELSGNYVNIKWVNDLYMNGKKICGILTEASFGLEMKSLDYIVIGIGINVRSHDFGAELNDRVTNIEDETGVKLDRNILCAAILDRLDYHISRLESGAHLDEYRRREILTGHRITANVGNEQIEALAVGIDDRANLVVRLDDGTERSLSSGEANLCRLKK